MITEEAYLDYLSSLLDGNKYRCLRIAEKLLTEDNHPVDIYTDLLQKSLYRIGQLWEKNRVCVAEEHLASSITEYVMTNLCPAFPRKELNGKKAVISTVCKEFHQIGAKMAADIFEINGWDVYFLGANTPCGDLTRIIEQIKPEALALSTTFYLNVLRLMESLDSLCAQNYDMKIYVGGQAFNYGGEDLIRKFNGKVIYVKSARELQEILSTEL